MHEVLTDAERRAREEFSRPDFVEVFLEAFSEAIQEIVAADKKRAERGHE